MAITQTALFVRPAAKLSHANFSLGPIRYENYKAYSQAICTIFFFFA